MQRNQVSWLVCAAAFFGSCLPCSASESDVMRGEFRYAPAADEQEVPEPFRLSERTLSFEQTIDGELPYGVRKSLVTFPSPVKTPYEYNNTVHCEYFEPADGDKVPAVVVLHILGGDFALSRMCCIAFAQRGVASLFLKMPYYGPRRQPGVERRMISKDPAETVEGMTQAVLDIRCAVAWLASRENVDEKRLGVFGISLGGITAALAASAEPRLKNVCLVLAGGDVGRVVWESSELAGVRENWEKQGGTRDEFVALIEKIDPVTYADNLRGRRILMLNAKKDEVIPNACTTSLWEALGRPEIVWYGGGHYSIIRHFFSLLARSTEFFAPKE